MGKLSILHIDTGKDRGGGQKQTLYLIEGLQAAGIRSLLICQPNNPLHRQCTEKDIPYKSVRVRGDLDVCAAWKISRFLRRNSFDIVHAHSAHAHSMALMARRFLRQKPAIAVTRQVMFPIKPNRLSRKKYSASGVRYIAISAAVSDELRKAGVNESNITLIPIGIDIKQIDSVDKSGKDAIREKFGIAPEDFVAGTVGTLIECKGQRFLLEAIPILRRHIPEIKCMIVGDGPLMKSLRSLAANLDITNQVIFTGFIPDANEMINAMDLFVLPSLSEGFSYAALEAMALEKPAVVSNVGGLKDLVRNGENGVLVPAGEPQQIAETVIKLYDNRPYAEQLARKGAHNARTLFTVDNMVNKTIQYYEKLTSATEK